MLDFNNILEEITNCESEDTLLETMQDEQGNEVHIIRQMCKNKDGEVLDVSIMAEYPDGTLYPEYADKKVSAAIKRIVGAGELE